MEAINFVYWLQGYLELSQDVSLNDEQIKIIQEHIALVLTKVTQHKVGIAVTDHTKLPSLQGPFCCKE